MKRCLDCNSTLKADETECYACGSANPVQGAGSKFGQGFTAFLQVAVVVSLALTVASLFFDFTPSFAKCSTTSIVLILVKSSADQMSDKKRS